MKHFYSFNQYLRDTYGGKVYKLALDAGMTCPTRDGTLDTGGCIFCSAGGSGEFAEKPCESISSQIQKAKARVAGKATDVVGYIAYFQSYTNTYAPVSILRKLYMDAISTEGIVGLSIATRPDCLGDDVLALLSEMTQYTKVFVELGLQTSREDTARYIRRGYLNVVYRDAVRALKARGIHVVTHLILGLPGETREDMLESVRYVVSSASDGIKLQLLHVLEGTDLATAYRAGEFSILEEDEYISLVCDAIAILPPDMVVHRITGDAPKRLLIAPLWSANKREVLNRMAREMQARCLIQGSRYIPK